MQIQYQVHLNEVVRNDNTWGHIHSRENRAVFKFVDPDNQTLIEQACLHHINLSPELNVSVARLAYDFVHDLPAGHAYAVNHAFFPRRSKAADRVFTITNRMLKLLRLYQTQADYAPNRLHNYIIDLINDGRLVADYYLNLPLKNGITVLVKA